MAALGTKLAVGTAKTATRLGGQTMGVYDFMMVTRGLSLHSKSLTAFVCLFLCVFKQRWFKYQLLDESILLIDASVCLHVFTPATGLYNPPPHTHTHFN